MTVGFQLPFDRLVKAVDEWAAVQRRSDVFAQTGNGAYRPQHIDASPWLDPPEFRARLEGASVIVSHAGMGTILSALELGKPLLVLPRRARLGETRNDHQVATAREFASRGWLLVAENEGELAAWLEKVVLFQPAARVGGQASPQLLERLRSFTRQVASRQS